MVNKIAYATPQMSPLGMSVTTEAPPPDPFAMTMMAAVAALLRLMETRTSKLQIVLAIRVLKKLTTRPQWP